MNHKSTLAKLLAKEDITVQYGNYHTAWFDIKDRVLGLPLWKDMGNDVTDLLIGHEVGHALYTPFEGWHDSPEKLEGCPRSYINVIEDARIERHIKENYAGLIGPMKRGYKKLFDDGFFGDDIKFTDWGNVKLIDKINLKAKVGNLLDVPFSSEEIVFYQRAMKTQTFAEVTDLVRDILAYTKENTPELIKQPEPPVENPEGQNEEKTQEGPSGHDDYDKETTNEEQTSETKTETTETEGKGEGEKSDTSENKSSERTEDDDTSNQGNVENQTQPEEDISETDENFRRKEHTLIDRDEGGNQVAVGNEFRKEIRDKVVISYEQLSADRNKYAYEKISDNMGKYDDFKSYMKEVKRNVNFAVKEFEMRKAAYRYSRAQTAKTGSIDVNRLWSYKTNDDIFSRVTKLADAKNHGMMMLIDYSGSMCDTMGQVMDQLLHLVVFCKTVNIPFDVYGFTSTNKSLGSYYEETEGPTSKEGELSHSGLSMPQIISSNLKKKQYEEALFHIYLRKHYCMDSYSYGERSILSKYEDYGSTPLNEALIVSHRLIKQFKNKNAVDKMNLVIMSDGDANRVDVVRSSKADYVDTDRYGKTIVNIEGKKVLMTDRGRQGTKSLLENIQKTMNVKTLGFFIADGSHNYWYKISDAKRDGPEGYGIYDNEERKPYNRQYAKHKCVTFQNTLGYNEFYIVKSGKNLNTEDDGFAPHEDATKGQITSQFKKYSKSKKNNKTLLTNFGKAVA